MSERVTANIYCSEVLAKERCLYKAWLNSQARMQEIVDPRCVIEGRLIQAGPASSGSHGCGIHGTHASFPAHM